MWGTRALCGGRGMPFVQLALRVGKRPGKVVLVKLALCSVLAGVALLVAAWQPGGHARAAGPQQPRIVAQHAIVVDASSGAILLDKSADAQVPPASLAKLFTATVALEQVSAVQQMTVHSDDLVGESNIGLQTGETLSLDALLHGMLLASGNDAAMTVAQNIGQLAGDSTRQAVGRFMDLTNARLLALGITDTTLRNPHGLDEDGQVSTAHDIAAITRFALDTQPVFAEAIGAASYHGAGHTIQQTNELLGQYPGLLGGKTGFTARAGYCLMEVAQRGDARVIVVLLGSTANAWYSDATALLDYGFTALVAPNAPRYGSLTSVAPVSASVPSATGVLANGISGAQLATSGAGHSRTPWRWLGAALLLVFGGIVGLAQALRGGLTSAESRTAPARPRAIARPRVAPATFETAPFRIVTPRDEPAPAMSLACEAVALAGDQDFHAAARAFYRAANLDERLDFTRVPGFWALCPRGHSAAAAALVKAGRLADARSLAIVLGPQQRPALGSSGD